MPTYTVTSANIQLSVDRKARIAAGITQAHNEATGAPGYFAQVIFSGLQGDDHFVGGRPNSAPHLFVYGVIRAGRTIEVKRTLISRIVDTVREAAGIGPEDIWVYVQDMDASQMVEFGRFLPQPGEEHEWQDGFSEEKRAAFAKAGIRL